MKKIQKLVFMFLAAGFLVSCGSKEATDTDDKKAKLEEYRKEMAELKGKISDLESEIASEEGPGAAASAGTSNAVLVSTLEVEKEPFVHKIEVRGSVESRKNAMISAETMSRIEKIHVSEGQPVKAGQLLIQLDADILENNISEIKTQLELAETVFKRQSSLWEQNIGTEIQYLQAKNNKESLERRLATLESQLRQYYVRAPFVGVVDNIPVKVGEMAAPGSPLVRVMNPNEMYISAEVSEAHLGKLAQGDIAEIHFPNQDIRLKSKLTSIGNVINEQNRTFSVEASLPSKDNFEFMPNQVVILTLVDYQKKEAISVPTAIIQSDSEGKYVFTVQSDSGQTIAKKARVVTGKSFDGETEILAGLEGNEKVINKGYQDVNEGVVVSLSTASL